MAELVLAPDDSPSDVRRHVESCSECAVTLAALSDVRRLVGEESLVPAPAGVRDRVMAQARTRPPPADDVVRPLASTVPAASRRGPRIPVWAAGLAAAVALVAGLGIGRVTVPEPAAPEPEDPGSVVAAADLTALDSDADRGVARAVSVDDMVTLRVSARELGDEDGFHEVWLINVDGTRMVALGVLADWDTGEFQVPRGLIEEGYRIVDISVEPEDGDPTHSGVSLARGELA
ncbi:hypothetical protein CXG46_04445 [Nocardioides alpinus]|uniref:Anti-sigma K factor RskA C-terminal domain-containing protein n=1 Tax=Nocardioides alpinus TaxID=748909 RepID=A0ABX4R0Z6_9ACTN|nr:hypothetical protein CXG46_04445 [Nocardioides alpinus]